jgi:hypothetical protein
MHLAYAIPLTSLFKSVIARLCVSYVQLNWLFLLFRFAFGNCLAWSRSSMTGQLQACLFVCFNWLLGIDKQAAGLDNLNY